MTWQNTKFTKLFFPGSQEDKRNFFFYWDLYIIWKLLQICVVLLNTTVFDSVDNVSER